MGKGIVAEIAARAAASPDEICGLLLGRPDRVAAVRHCANVAARPARAFEIDPRALIGALRDARRGGPRVVGCYHSHPGGIPVPSQRDAEAAAADGWLWLIVAGDRLGLYRAVERGLWLGRFDPLRWTEDGEGDGMPDGPAGGDQV